MTDFTTDLGKIGDEIAKLEMKFRMLAHHPDHDIRKRALLYLEQVETMKQEIKDAIQNLADAKAGDNID